MVTSAAAVTVPNLPHAATAVTVPQPPHAVSVAALPIAAHGPHPSLHLLAAPAAAAPGPPRPF